MGDGRMWESGNGGMGSGRKGERQNRGKEETAEFSFFFRPFARSAVRPFLRSPVPSSNHAPASPLPQLVKPTLLGLLFRAPAQELCTVTKPAAREVVIAHFCN